MDGDHLSLSVGQSGAAVDAQNPDSIHWLSQRRGFESSGVNGDRRDRELVGWSKGEGRSRAITAIEGLKQGRINLPTLGAEKISG
ncbi:hypothetical protein NL676_022377 [Syzygium grande]|nr:hypothetical protein NL676_022377 [Syzygium grande]